MSQHGNTIHEDGSSKRGLIGRGIRLYCISKAAIGIAKILVEIGEHILIIYSPSRRKYWSDIYVWARLCFGPSGRESVVRQSVAAARGTGNSVVGMGMPTDELPHRECSTHRQGFGVLEEAGVVAFAITGRLHRRLSGAHEFSEILVKVGAGGFADGPPMAQWQHKSAILFRRRR